MKYCPYCGTPLDDDMTFCHKCGRTQSYGKARENEPVVVSEENADPLENFSPNEGAKDEIDGLDENENNATVINHTEPLDKSGAWKKRPWKIFLAGLFLVAIVVIIIFVTGRFAPAVNNLTITANGQNSIFKDSVSVNPSDSVLYLELYDDEGNIVGSASGFIAFDASTLVTNYHVIEDAYKIIAKDRDGNNVTTLSTVYAYDEESDLAILVCDYEPEIIPLPLADSDTAKQGDVVIAIGYPLGITNTRSEGIVSSRLNENGADIIMITAAISSGSSGGALLNENNEVIGVTSASYVDGQNMNIAISSNAVKMLKQSEMEQVDLVTLYGINHRYGTTAYNLADGCVTVDDGEIMTYCTSLLSGDKIKKIWLDHYSTAISIAHGKALNYYRGNLYYFDEDIYDICCLDPDSKESRPLGLISNEIIHGTTDGKFSMDVPKISVDSMLIAHDKIFVNIDMYSDPDNTDLFGPQEHYLVVYDFNNDHEVLFISDYECNSFSYYDDTVYAPALYEPLMMAIDMDNLTEEIIKLPAICEITGALDNGTIYLLNTVPARSDAENYVYEYNSVSEKMRTVFTFTPTAVWAIFSDDENLYLASTNSDVTRILYYDITDGEQKEILEGSLQLSTQYGFTLNGDLFNGISGAFIEFSKE